MSLNDTHAGPHAKLIYMANQIAKFMEAKPHDEGLTLAQVKKWLRDQGVTA